MTSLEKNINFSEIQALDKLIKDNECKLKIDLSDRYSRITGI